MNLLFNILDLKELLSNFYTLTKIRIVIFDDSFHELASYPTRHSSYCRIIRNDFKAEEKCISCDQQACLHCKRTQQLYTYQCHAGLTETVVPIKAENIIIGYIMFGQLLQTDNRNTLWNDISKNLSSFNIDMNELHKAYTKKKNISKDTIAAAANMMEISASYLYLSRKLILKEDTLANKIDTYINTHIKDDLSATILCKNFNISKSRLYKISEHSFGMGIAEHIRNIRIHIAKRLLGDTDIPIYEIADMVGINDYNYFTKVFKRETEVLPTTYRKENTMR
jgi:AraC-type DNA-binding domain-containing proteins